MCQKNRKRKYEKSTKKPKKPSPPTRPLLSELTQNLLSIQNCAPFKKLCIGQFGSNFTTKKTTTQNDPSMTNYFQVVYQKLIGG